MTTKGRFGLACSSLVLWAGLAIACSSPTPSPAPVKSEPPPAANSTATWGGDLTSVVSLREMMHDVIDPLADNIFDAVGAETTSKGTRTWEPKTPAEWDKLKIGGVSMAEAVYLLKLPRPIEQPGHEVKADTGSGELSAADVLAKIQKDPVLWQAKIEALRNVGREVLQIVEKKDANALSDAAADLDAACEGCHLEFWYPSQKELLRRLFQPTTQTSSARP